MRAEQEIRREILGKIIRERSVDKLNEIQREWMALDPHAPEKEKQRVFKLMTEYPKKYLSVSEDKQEAIVIIDGAPMSAKGLPLDYTKQNWGTEPGLRFDVAWCGKLGQWVTLP